MNIAAGIAFGFLAIGLGFALWRLIEGPSIADRVVATDLFLTFLVMSAGVLSVRSGQGDYLEVMLVIAVVGFLGTAMVARFIERRGA
jgi:multicomponent Na+:H+ antiporter subunit F